MSAPSGRGPSDRALIAVLVALALVLRVVVALEYERRHPYAEHLVIDEAAYDAWAVAIAEGDWIGDEVFFQEPAYPYWLASIYAFFGHDRTAVRHMQSALGALTVALVFVLARRVFGRAPAIVAAALLAIYQPALLLASLVLKPNLVLPVVATLALAVLSTRDLERGSRAETVRWALVGVLAGVGALLRGNLLLCAPLLCLWPLARGGAPLGRRARPALACAFGVALVLLPVAARNQAVGGVFALTTSGAGTNVYGGNNPDNPYGRATELDWVRGIPEYEARDWRHEAERRLGRPLDAGEVSAYWLGEVARSVREQPLLHVRILWNKLRLTLGRYEVPDNHHLAWDARRLATLGPWWPGFGVLGALALAGVALLALARGADRPARAREAAELAAIAGLYLATIVLTVTSMRVRLALVPLLAPFAGWFVVACVARLRARGRVARGPGPLALAASLALGAAAVWTPVLSAAERAADLDKRDFNYVHVLLDDPERLDEAWAIATRLDRAYPGTSRVELLLAELEVRRARAASDELDAAARAAYASALERTRAVATHPDANPRERFRARKLAAFLQLDLGHAQAAESHLRAALGFDPEDDELRSALARVLLVRAEDEPPAPARGLRAEAEQLARAVAAGAPAGEPVGWDARLVLANLLFLRASAATDAPAGSAPSVAERAALVAQTLALLDELAAARPEDAAELAARRDAVRALVDRP